MRAAYLSHVAITIVIILVNDPSGVVFSLPTADLLLLNLLVALICDGRDELQVTVSQF